MQRNNVASGRVARRCRNGQANRMRQRAASAKQGGEAQARTARNALDRSTDKIHNKTRSRMNDWQNIVLRLSQEPDQPETSEPDARLQALEALIAQPCSYTPKSILMRGVRPQTKWSTEGDVVQSSLSETEMTPQCAAVFQNENTLIETLELGLQRGILRCSSKEGRDVIHLNEAQTLLPSSNISPIDGLIFISHAFPLQEALERG